MPCRQDAGGDHRDEYSAWPQRAALHSAADQRKARTNVGSWPSSDEVLAASGGVPVNAAPHRGQINHELTQGWATPYIGSVLQAGPVIPPKASCPSASQARKFAAT
jgi:hypothetical protein